MSGRASRLILPQSPSPALPPALSRRGFLQWGGLGSLSLGGLWIAEATRRVAGAATPGGRDAGRAGRAAGAPAGGQRLTDGLPPIRACIFVFYYGGPSHLDTYDMKPDAPANVRGEFQPIASTVPGLPICEHLPYMARVMHHCGQIRSLRHTNRLHDSASIETHTGRQAAQGDREEFAPIEQFFPCHGATVSALRESGRPVVSHASLPFVFQNVIPVPCQGGGFLGGAYDPFRISVDPDRQSYAVPELLLRDELPGARIQQRLALLRNGLAGGRRGGTGLGSAAGAGGELPGGFGQFYDRACDLLQSEAVREALDISREPVALRERYGIYGNTSQGGTNGAEQGYARHMRGQNLLVARRLVEAGVPFVNVFDFRQQGQNWDSHAQNFVQHREHLLPPADRALSALIEDLAERGLLDSTLVVATGEFGRTPQINGQAGRDHWPDCYTAVVAGGGVQGGAIHGASDKLGAYPARDPATPADLAATIYWRFGLDPAGHVRDRLGRPWKLAEGEPLAGLFGA